MDEALSVEARLREVQRRLAPLAGRKGLGPLTAAIAKLAEAPGDAPVDADAARHAYLALFELLSDLLAAELEKVEGTLAAVALEHPSRAAVEQVKQMFTKQREGLELLATFLNGGDAGLLATVEAVFAESTAIASELRASHV